MAYMDQKKKAAIAPKVKVILGQYGVHGTLSVRNHSTLVLNIKSGTLDFFSDLCQASAKELKQKREHMSINVYHYKDQFDGKARQFLEEAITAMNDGNHDRSDTMTDYFDVGWYVDVNVGQWDSPYQCTAVRSTSINDSQWGEIGIKIMSLPDITNSDASDLLIEPADFRDYESRIQFVSAGEVTDDTNGQAFGDYLRKNGCVVRQARPRTMVVQNADLVKLFL